jgi:hypothetical protein
MDNKLRKIVIKSHAKVVKEVVEQVINTGFRN